MMDRVLLVDTMAIFGSSVGFFGDMLVEKDVYGG